MDYEKKYNEANKIYHLCFRENKVPGSSNEHNRQLEKVGVTVSLKYRRGPIFKEDSYLVFWWENSTKPRVSFIRFKKNTTTKIGGIFKYDY